MGTTSISGKNHNKNIYGFYQGCKKIIEDEIAETFTLNLASVDPNEIVVFQDEQGKLKTSNVSLDAILIRRRDAADNAIALFQDGKLKPGALVYDSHRETNNSR